MKKLFCDKNIFLAHVHRSCLPTPAGYSESVTSLVSKIFYTGKFFCVCLLPVECEAVLRFCKFLFGKNILTRCGLLTREECMCIRARDSQHNVASNLRTLWRFRNFCYLCLALKVSIRTFTGCTFFRLLWSRMFVNRKTDSWQPTFDITSGGKKFGCYKPREHFPKFFSRRIFLCAYTFPETKFFQVQNFFRVGNFCGALFCGALFSDTKFFRAQIFPDTKFFGAKFFRKCVCSATLFRS